MSFISSLIKNTAETLGLAEKSAQITLPPDSLEDIQQWLTNNVAKRTNVDPANIDHETSFSQLGLDSLSAVNISSQLEQWLNVEIEPTVVYEYSNIASLSDFLARKVNLA